MAGEELARRIVQANLNRAVVLNDDGSAPEMYDLRIGSAKAPEIAIECIGAVDPLITETWNIGPAKGPIQLAVTHDWLVEITPKTRVKSIKQTLEPILQELESRQISNLNVDHRLKWQDEELFEKLEILGITDLMCFNEEGSGKVHLTMPGKGGVVDSQGDSVPVWIGEFLRGHSRQDVLLKLQRSGAKICEVFVMVALDGATWAVESYLSGELQNVPKLSPDLPHPITGVWIVSSMGQSGVRWDGHSWELFRARGKGINE